MYLNFVFFSIPICTHLNYFLFQPRKQIVLYSTSTISCIRPGIGVIIVGASPQDKRRQIPSSRVVVLAACGVV